MAMLGGHRVQLIVDLGRIGCVQKQVDCEVTCAGLLWAKCIVMTSQDFVII